MGVRILVINPLGTPLFDAHVEQLLAGAVAPDTEVTVRSLSDGVPATAFLPATSLFLNQLLAAVEQGERDGYDAAVIACCSDPGLADAKELVSIPVTGPMEAAVHTGAPLGRLGVIAPRIASGENENLPVDSNWVRRLIHQYGAEASFAGVRLAHTEHPSVEETAELLEDDPDRLRDLVHDGMRAAVEGPAGDAAVRAWSEDEATVLLFACTHWGGMLEPVRRRVPITLLDPLLMPVQFAETLARVGRLADVGVAA
jgi:Asp/Glu/hydantoin racemase